MENWREILNNTELQDVEFEFLDREEKVGAHKLILASVSPVFKAMLFTSGLLESFGSISKIKIVDYSPADIREFMNYLYLGLVPLNFSITLWNLGAKYIVKGMLDALLRHFTKDIEHPKLYDDYIKLAKAQGLALWEESLQTQQLEITKRLYYEKYTSGGIDFSENKSRKYFKTFENREKLDKVILQGAKSLFLERKKVFLNLFSHSGCRTLVDTQCLFGKGKQDITFDANGDSAYKWEIHIRFLDNEDVIKSDVWEFTVDDVRWVPMEDKN